MLTVLAAERGIDTVVNGKGNSADKGCASGKVRIPVELIARSGQG